jgi:hypothetical protein
LGAVALGVLWPTLSPTLADLGRSLAPAAVAMGIAAFVVVVANGRGLDATS